MTPVETSKRSNEDVVRFNLYGKAKLIGGKTKFKVGDRVRISKYKRIVFDKGFEPNFTEEVFVVVEVQRTNPITYRLKDLAGEEIKGSFYEQELEATHQEVFRVDKVLKRDYKNKRAFVSWSGYPKKINSLGYL